MGVIPAEDVVVDGDRVLIVGSDVLQHLAVGGEPFTIEVEPADTLDDFIATGDERSLRVYVERILPIEQIVLAGDQRFVVDGESDDNGLTLLPAAARPGMWLVECRTVPENVEDTVPEDVKCPTCNGDGDDLQPGGYGQPPPCPDCKGTGRTPDNVECQTCGDRGWIVVNQTIGWPHGEQVQCPDCWAPENVEEPTPDWCIVHQAPKEYVDTCTRWSLWVPCKFGPTPENVGCPTCGHQTDPELFCITCGERVTPENVEEPT